MTVEYFSWRKALVGRYDVFHVHWPEVLLRGTSPAKTALRCVAFLMVMLRIRCSRAALVRTLHNTEPHERPGAVQNWLLRLCDRSTSLWITLSVHVTTPDPDRTVVIPHGHYRDWYAETVRECSSASITPGRLLNIGLVRPYKGVEALLDAFADLPGNSETLRIVGKFQDEELGERIWTACHCDSRVSAVDDYVDECTMTKEVTASELVVLPFVKSTNSGSMLLALSLDRPVLVPDGPVVAEIAEKAGPGWVQTFSGPLTSGALMRALKASREMNPGSRPDLSTMDWPAIGSAHARAFAQAITNP